MSVIAVKKRSWRRKKSNNIHRFLVCGLSTLTHLFSQQSEKFQQSIKNLIQELFEVFIVFWLFPLPSSTHHKIWAAEIYIVIPKQWGYPKEIIFYQKNQWKFRYLISLSLKVLVETFSKVIFPEKFVKTFMEKCIWVKQISSYHWHQ